MVTGVRLPRNALSVVSSGNPKVGNAGHVNGGSAAGGVLPYAAWAGAPKQVKPLWLLGARTYDVSGGVDERLQFFFL
jgi:hypothetical protein